jgi:transcriptional regulator with XRE-family HTH domain
VRWAGTSQHHEAHRGNDYSFAHLENTLAHACVGCLRYASAQRKIDRMPKEKPKVAIGEVIRSYRSDRGLSQGDIERRTGLLRCYLSRVENGHTVPSLETLAKIAEALEISLADFFPGSDTPQDRETRKMLGELSEEEIRFLAEIKKYTTTLSDEDKKLVLAMIRKMATLPPPPARKAMAVGRRPAY